jgi:hypothetical protein
MTAVVPESPRHVTSTIAEALRWYQNALCWRVELVGAYIGYPLTGGVVAFFVPGPLVRPVLEVLRECGVCVERAIEAHNGTIAPETIAQQVDHVGLGDRLSPDGGDRVRQPGQPVTDDHQHIVHFRTSIVPKSSSTVAGLPRASVELTWRRTRRAATTGTGRSSAPRAQTRER